jgi:hypothetical protein
LLSADAEFADRAKIRDIAGPLVTKVDPVGIAHLSYSFKGQGRSLLLGCPAGHASLVVHFHLRSALPVSQ